MTARTDHSRYLESRRESPDLSEPKDRVQPCNIGISSDVIQNKAEFIQFINSLPIKDSTKRTYRNWVRRLDEHLPKGLSFKSVQSEADVQHIASLMPKTVFTPAHLKDVRCLIRYYLKFILSRGIVVEQEIADSEGAFAPSSAAEARSRVLRSIALRRGQRQFRNNLLTAYGGRCCVTRTNAEDVLEAAHIQPYAAAGANSIKNGLLLRSDIHILFDLRLLSINPRFRTVFCDKVIRSISAYAKLHGQRVTFPKRPEMAPDFHVLKLHYDETRGL